MLRAQGSSRPAERRVIVWPKAYMSTWSVSLPVLEALQLCWDLIQPCELHMLAVDETTRMWYLTLPEAMRAHCHLAPRIPRQQALELMAKARVVLIPSLVDGIPNSMFEAMAFGALPIVAPLATITPEVQDGLNVLFARNLYPNEIAEALKRAMSDDDLVEQAARVNLELVHTLADRVAIAPQVIAFYDDVTREARRS